MAIWVRPRGAPRRRCCEVFRPWPPSPGVPT